MRPEDDLEYKHLSEASTNAILSGDSDTGILLSRKAAERLESLRNSGGGGNGFMGLGTLFSPKYSPVSQEELTKLATRALSPAGRAVLTDGPVAPLQFDGPRPAGFSAISDMELPGTLRQATARQLSTLGDEEKKNLGTVLVNKHNVGYQAFEDQAKKQSMGAGFSPASRLLGYRL